MNPSSPLVDRLFQTLTEYLSKTDGCKSNADVEKVARDLIRDVSSFALPHCNVEICEKLNPQEEEETKRDGRVSNRDVALALEKINTCISDRAQQNSGTVLAITMSRGQTVELVEKMRSLNCESVAKQYEKSVESIDKQLEWLQKEEKQNWERRDALASTLMDQILKV